MSENLSRPRTGQARTSNKTLGWNSAGVFLARQGRLTGASDQRWPAPTSAAARTKCTYSEARRAAPCLRFLGHDAGGSQKGWIQRNRDES